MLASDPLIKRITGVFVRLAPGLKALSSYNLNDNAVLLESTNRFAEAEPRFRQAVQMCGDSFGAFHPNSIAVQNNWKS